MSIKGVNDNKCAQKHATTMIIPNSVGYYLELHGVVMSYSGVQFSLTKV